MKSIKLKKHYGDVALNNVLVPETTEDGASLKLDFAVQLSTATKTLCLVMDGGVSDEIAKALDRVRGSVRIYALVPKIDEQRLARLKGKAIIREVPGIKGNYCIIDDGRLLVFNGELCGAVIESSNAAEAVKAIFKREFWELAREEFIERKLPCAEHTFDIPVPYGNGEVIVDYSSDGETPLARLIREADISGYTGKIPTDARGEVYFRDVKLNSDYLKRANGGVYMYPSLPFGLLVKDGERYAVSFNLSDYGTLPEREKGRLFAVRLPRISLGECYKLYGHRTVGELVGSSVFLSDGERIEVKSSHTEKRTILADLRLASELCGLESDPEMLEQRLLKRNPALLDTGVYAEEITFTVALQMPERQFGKKAKVYSDYETANAEYSKKLAQLKELVGSLGDAKASARLEKIAKKGEFTSRDEYASGVEALNGFIDELNNVDSLGELLGGKKSKRSVQPLKPVSLGMDTPAFGILYESKGRYEYVLRRSRDLDGAITEMRGAGIDEKSVAYLEEK